MSYKASVSNIYELLDEEGGSTPQVNLGGDDKGPTKKATTAPAKAQQQMKPKQEAPKASERPAQQKAPRQERSIDRRPPREFSSPKAGEGVEEGKQQRRPKEGGERRFGGERGAGRGAFVPRGNKRPFDRRSGTGRGKEDKKGGAGKGNWGTFQDDQKVGEEVERQEEKTPAETEVQPQGEQPQGGDAATEQKQEQPKEPEEEEDKTRTLDDFLKSKAAVKVELPKARTAGEGVDNSEWKGFTPLKKDEEDLGPLSKKGEAKKKESKKEVVPVNQVFNIPEESPKTKRGGRGEGRGGFSQRGGSAGGRGGKRGGQGRAAPNVQDESAFPALAGKA